jgi:flagellar hook-basal body complex protein FliE
MAIDAISSGVQAATAAVTSTPSTADATAGATAFGDSLGRLLGAANAADGEANGAVGRMIAGTGDVHEAMIALQQADLMLQLTVQVRNKIVQAYQDIMRMPV